MEHGVNPPVKTYWDAFDWALMNVTTVGSNIFGVTKIGQILAVILAAAGMIFRGIPPRNPAQKAVFQPAQKAVFQPA